MSEIKSRPFSDPDREHVFGRGYADIIDTYDWDASIALVESATEEDVESVLQKARRNLSPLSPEDFAVLISEAAAPKIDEMAFLSRHFTSERFGKTISMYIPMYVGNACTNKCVYCGFNHDNPMERTVLAPSGGIGDWG